MTSSGSAGPGVGVLTDFLAARVAHVHAIELDRRLALPLEHLLTERANVSLVWGDAVDANPALLEPLPTKLISNLPYNVAAPIIAETLQHVPSITTICVMVQREMADRFAAPVGSASYGALSVLIQAVCVRTGMHKVGRGVFAPPPNVDSALVAFERRPAGEGVPTPEEVPAFASFVKSSFGLRRKTLGNNLSATEVATRAEVVTALEAIGLKAAARPQELAPAQFVGVLPRTGCLTAPDRACQRCA